MKKIRWFLLALLLLGAGLTGYAKGEAVSDQAGILTTRQEQSLEEQFDGIREEYRCDLGVVTVESCGGRSIQSFTDDYYYRQGYGMGEERSGILLMISMGDREWYVATRGEAIRVFTDYGLEILEEQIVPYLSEGEYERAFETFGDLCENFLKEAKENRPYDRDHPYRRPMPLWLRGVICLVSGLAVGGGILAVLTAQLRSVGYEKRAQEYVRDGSFRITGARDLFLYRTITSRRIERSHPGGGGSSTHRTSDGGRAGGRGGSF